MNDLYFDFQIKYFIWKVDENKGYCIVADSFRWQCSFSLNRRQFSLLLRRETAILEKFTFSIQETYLSYVENSEWLDFLRNVRNQTELSAFLQISSTTKEGSVAEALLSCECNYGWRLFNDTMDFAGEVVSRPVGVKRPESQLNNTIAQIV